MRVTKKYLANWVNDQLLRKGMKRKVSVIESTNYTQDQYEKGAYKTMVYCGYGFTLYSTYSLAEMQTAISKGEKLYIKNDNRTYDWTIEITLKGGIPRRPKGQKDDGDGLTMGVMGRLARELEEINPRATPETSRPEPEQKAAELLTAYTEEVDAFTGARQLHTGTLVKRLLHLALTELINATECRDPATAIYYEAVQRCILTKTIK